MLVGHAYMDSCRFCLCQVRLGVPEVLSMSALCRGYRARSARLTTLLVKVPVLSKHTTSTLAIVLIFSG